MPRSINLGNAVSCVGNEFDRNSWETIAIVSVCNFECGNLFGIGRGKLKN